MRRNKSHLLGFTLIELMVVVSIVGMLSSISLVSLQGARDKATIAASNAYQSSMYRTLGTGSVLYVNFESGAAPIVDISNINSGMTATITGTPTWVIDTYSAVVSKFALNVPSGTTITFPKSLGIQKSNFTISAWLKVTPPMFGYYYYFKNTDVNDGYKLGINSLTGLRVEMGSTIDGFATAGSCSGTKIAGTWTHIVVEFDRTNLVANCYKNGKKTDSLTIYALPNMNDAAPYIPSFNGVIDDLIVYNTNLGAVAVNELYESQRGKYLTDAR